MRRFVLLCLPAMLAVLVAAAPAAAAPQDTTTGTLVDADGDGRLEAGPGEPLVPRTDLATPSGGATPSSLAFFGQLTDTHVVDEESPLRVEFTDRLGGLFTSAYRPQEGLSPHVIDQMVRRLTDTTSPVSGRPLDLVMTTGDNTDNTQCNETRWLIDLLDGGKDVQPDSGVDGLPPRLSPTDLCLGEGHVAVPVPPTCVSFPDGRRYDGVRGAGEYYEPDGSGPGEDGVGYTPADGVRDFPGLFERMNEPLRAKGLGGLPWYATFGNHDGLIQGNQPRNPALEALAVACAKVHSIAGSEAMGVAGALADPASRVRVTPADQRRRPLRKSEFIAEHFRTSGVPVGHGFTPENVASGMGNYAFSPKPGLRFISLDTISEAGLEAGNVDDAQFRWLHEQLLLADAAKELVVVFAHHSLRTMGQPPLSPFPPGDTGGDLSPAVHFGLGPRETDIDLPCPTTDPLAPTRLDETVKCLLLRHPSVVAFVNGHEHANRIDPFARPGGGGFWEINTASHIDFPQQSRVVEILDNADGTIAIATAVVDHAAPADPGDGAANPSAARLASISRELSLNDRHAHPETSRGRPEDRNALLHLPHPHAP